MGPTGLDCPVSPPSTCGRTTPIFGSRASQQLFVSIRTSASSNDQGTSTAVPSGASSSPAPKGFPPSGPPLAAHPDKPADLSTSVLACLARSANAPLSSDNTSVCFGLLNIRSLTGKGHLVQDLLTDRKLDFMCRNETWQLPGDFSQLNDCTPPGFVYLCKPRGSGRGGGLVILYREKWKVAPVSVPPFSSLECLACQISGPTPTIIATVYRPLKPHTKFLNEFSALLTHLSTLSLRMSFCWEIST